MVDGAYCLCLVHILLGTNYLTWHQQVFDSQIQPIRNYSAVARCCCYVVKPISVLPSVFVAEFGHKFYLEEMLWQQRKDEDLSLPPGFHSHAMATRYIMRLKKLSCMESKIFSTFPRTMKAMVSLSQDKRTQMVLIIGNF